MKYPLGRTYICMFYFFKKLYQACNIIYIPTIYIMLRRAMKLFIL